jgi:hypothetical protein
MPWAPTCGYDPARCWVHAPADLRARVRGGMVISVLQDLNELRRSRSRASPRSEHWRPERWREVTGSHHPTVRFGEGFLAMVDDSGRVDLEASRGYGGDRSVVLVADARVIGPTRSLRRPAAALGGGLFRGAVAAPPFTVCTGSRTADA